MGKLGESQSLSRGREFQSLGAALKKARSPKVWRLDLGLERGEAEVDEVDDRRSVRYGGAGGEGLCRCTAKKEFQERKKTDLH